MILEGDNSHDANANQVHISEANAPMCHANSDSTDSITTSSDWGSFNPTADVVDEETGYESTCALPGDFDFSMSSEAILIFDYDDTLFPTSYLTQRGYRLEGSNASLEVQILLDEFSKVVEKTLRCAQMYGRVFIVTNAETGWIELTSKKYMPRLSNVLSQYPLISARSKYEPLGVMSPCQWKVHAFGDLLQSESLKGNVAFNLLSFGDSAHERDAAHFVCQEFEQIHCKSVKFMERPDIDQLSRQHTLITGCLEQVICHRGTLDLCIQFESSENSEPFSTVPSSGISKIGSFL